MQKIFHNKSKSYLPMSKETVRMLWEMSIAAGRKTSELNKVLFIEPKMPNFGAVSAANFQSYVMAITGHLPCPICNGPRGYWFVPPSITCLFFPIHSIITRSSVSIDRWELSLGKICTHGFYSAECKDCLTNEIERIFALTAEQSTYNYVH